jgi:hypothetical protein
VFPLANRLRFIHPLLIVEGAGGVGGTSLSYKMPGFLLAFTFNYYIKKRYLAWWEKYDYLLSASINGGGKFGG